MIPQETIDLIFSTLDIVDVIGDYVKLDKRGTNYVGKCPFHNEKTGSFIVNRNKGIYKCFGCGVGGNAINFVMAHTQLSYPEALKKVAKKYQIEIKERELKPEEKKEKALKEEVHEFYTAVMEQYHSNLFLEQNARALTYLRSRFSDIDIKAYKLGYAPDSWDYLTKWAKSFKKNVSQIYLQEFLEKTGLFGIREKDGGLYDFFRDRIIFPFFDKFGQCYGFNGRDIVKKEKSSKYINLPDTPVFKKDFAVFGLQYAFKTIKENDKVFFVEGQTDVIRCQVKELTNTLASSGTSLTENQALTIKSITKNFHLLFDGDDAGVKALKKRGEMLLKLGCNVEFSLLPDGKDPDEFFRDYEGAAVDWVDDHTEDYINYFCQKDFEENKTNPARRKAALSRISKMLSYIRDGDVRDLYISDFVRLWKKYNISKTMLKTSLEDDDEYIEKAKEIGADNLPAYLSKDEINDYYRYNFYEGKEKDINQMIFMGHGRLSNFIMLPLYHIKSLNNTRKLFELHNSYGEIQIIDIDMDEMTSLSKFRRSVESRGNFLFEGTEREFIKLRRKLYDKTKYCYAIENLGWQKEGFWAWANGISRIDGSFQVTDDYGIVSHKIKNKDKEIENRNFFIPAFSSIYADDKSIFLDERKFEYRQREASWETFSTLFIKVYQKKAIMSLAFYLTSIFSDFIFNYLGSLPLLNLFGVKGTGKNEHSMDLLCLFGEYQSEVQLNNATLPGIAAKLESFQNAIIWFDEYKNNLDPVIIESMKGIYNRNGRTRGSMQAGKKKETTPIHSMVIISGQEMLTADVALFSRVILLSYSKTEHSQEAVKLFNQLKELTTDSTDPDRQIKTMSHITHNLIKYRKTIEAEYPTVFKQVQSDFMEMFKHDRVEDRIVKNYVTVLATVKVLNNFIFIPMSWDEIVKTARELIIFQNDQIKSSNEIAQFWTIFESLVDRGVFKMGTNFEIRAIQSIRLYRTPAERDEAQKNPEKFKKDFETVKQVLFVRWTDVYQHYSELAAKMREQAFSKSSLEYYLTSSLAYLGKGDNFRFGQYTGNPYMFDYDLLNINLTKHAEGREPLTDNEGFVTERAPDAKTDKHNAQQPPAVAEINPVNYNDTNPF